MTPATLPAVLIGAGGHTCIAFKAGRKYLHVVAMGAPISVQEIPIANDLRELRRGALPYPVKRAVRAYLKSELAKTERAVKTLRAIARKGRA